jgi:hypothetical protein
MKLRKDPTSISTAVILGSDQSPARLTRQPSGRISRSDSLISLKGQEESDYGDTTVAMGTLTGFQMTARTEIDVAPGSIAEISNQVWFYAHAQQPRREAAHVRGYHGVIVGGRTKRFLTNGEKRLQRVISQASPNEAIAHAPPQRSILGQSLCARRVVDFMRSSAMALPTFLQEPEVAKNPSAGQ